MRLQIASSLAEVFLLKKKYKKNEKKSFCPPILPIIVSSIVVGLMPCTQTYAAPTPPAAAQTESAQVSNFLSKIFKDPKHVVAIINNKKVTVEDINSLAKTLELSLGHVPEEKRYAAMIGLYTEMQILATAAEKQGYEKGSDFQKQMELARSNVLQKIYFQKQVLDKISDADLKARYNKEIASLPKEEEVRARHILVKTKAEAKAIIDRLNKGEKFEDLAKKLSKDGSASVGGDLGYFVRGQMVKPFEAVAFTLKPGQYTKKPVETPFGWHVIKIEDKRLKQPPSFEDLKDVIRNLIARDKSAAIMKDLYSKYPISYPDAEISKMMKEQKEKQEGKLPGEVGDDADDE